MNLGRADLRVALVALAVGAGCDAGREPATDGTADVVLAPDTSGASDAAGEPGGTDTELPGEPIPEEPQRPGDPARGLLTLSQGSYVGCGVPAELYPVADRAGLFGDEPPLPGRDSPLPYYLSQFVTASGVEVIGPNCFSCHAGEVAGELVLGAPGIDLDFGGFAADVAQMQAQVAALEGVMAPRSYAELQRFVARLAAIAPYVQTRVAGTNPADNLAGVLFSHRDPKTLAWSDEPLFEPPPEEVLPVDVPPLWRMKKKHAMLYSAGGRGDHARIMMTTSTLCVDTREEAEAIDATFGDVRAWIASLSAPAWPEEKLGALDRELARGGEEVFARECAGCHGTYGASDAEDTYPNLWIRVDEVGTDDALALHAAHSATRFVDWFNASFYGETARLEPKPGYVAPPLDGIWATAPYLHNGSVPTLAALLDSSARPRYWRRTSTWDAEHVGLGFEVSEVGQDQLSGASKRFVYDTTLSGHGNGGHFYGDALSEAERRAVIEYLKTL